MTATDRTPPPLKWLCLGNRDANDGFELFAHGIYARNGALVGSKLSLRERRQRVDLSAFLSCAPPLLAEAAVKHLLARLLCVHRHNTDLELLGKNFIPLHASSLGNAGVCERILASARQLQQHQVELCLLLAIDEQEPASAEYLASLARLRDSGVRIALHPQRIDTDARQCFAEVDAGLCDYLSLDARLLAPGPLTRNLRQRKSIEYLNRLLVAQDIQMLCLNVDNEELHQQANALPFAFRHGRHYSEPFQAWPFSSPAC